MIVLLVLGSAVLVAGGVYAARHRKMPIVIDPILLAVAFLAQFYMIGPFALLVVEPYRLPFAFSFDESRVFQAVAGFTLFSLCACLGYGIRFGSIVQDWLPAFDRGRRRLPGWWAEALFLGASIAGIVGWLAFQGGLMAKLSSGYGQWKSGGALFRIAFVALQVGTLLTVWRVFSTESRRLRDRLLLAGVLLFQFVFFGLIYGVRKYLFFMTIGVVTVFVLRRGVRQLPKVKTAAVLALLLVFFSFWGAIRNRPLAELIQGDDNPAAREQAPYMGYLTGIGGPFYVACLVYEVFPQHEEFRHGSTLLVTALGFIPRAIWPEKPVGIGKEFTRYVVGPFYEPVYGFSVTVTLPADLYLNFGWSGILIGGVLVGFVLRLVSSYATRGMVGGLQYRAARVLIPATILMGLGEVRADASVILATYALSLIPLIATFLVFRLDYVEPPTTVARRQAA